MYITKDKTAFICFLFKRKMEFVIKQQTPTTGGEIWQICHNLGAVSLFIILELFSLFYSSLFSMFFFFGRKLLSPVGVRKFHSARLVLAIAPTCCSSHVESHFQSSLRLLGKKVFCGTQQNREYKYLTEIFKVLSHDDSIIVSIIIRQ